MARRVRPSSRIKARFGSRHFGIDGSFARFDDLGELLRIQADVRGAGRARDDAVLSQPPEALPHLMQALRALENDLVILGASHGGPTKWLAT